MFKNFTIKTKLLALVITSLLSLGFIISVVAVVNTKETIIQNGLDKLSTIESTKHLEIQEYFKTIESLLFSMSTNIATQDAFTAFEDSFYKIDTDIELSNEDIEDALELEYSSNYVNFINFDVPGTLSKRLLLEYIPKNLNAKVAQYAFIVTNPAELSQKNALIYDKQYESSYMQALTAT